MKTKKQLTLYVDTRRCMGCRACEIACKLENNLPAGPRYTMVTETEVVEDGSGQAEVFAGALPALRGRAVHESLSHRGHL